MSSQTPLPQLIKRSDTYDLIVPAKVEEKIRYLIRKFPSTEWSGVLFYTHKGSFEDKNLVITCEDIFPMDIGSSTYTEFNMSPEVASYMADNTELFNCDMGLVHSHHSLGAFFSGTDLNTLRSEGNDMNNFVSLIVDTKGTYVAAITRKVKQRKKVTVEYTGTSYSFFSDKEVKSEETTTPVTQDLDETVIEYFMLNVKRHIVSNPLEGLDERFDEIIRQKQEAKPEKNSFYPSNDSYYNVFDEDGWQDLDEPFQLPEKGHRYSLFAQSAEPDDNWKPDSKLIYRSVCRMVTGNLMLDTLEYKFYLGDWIKFNMGSAYERMFFSTDQIDGYIEFITDSMVYNYKEDRGDNNIGWNHTKAIAEAMVKVLKPFNGYNEYIPVFISYLEQYK